MERGGRTKERVKGQVQGKWRDEGQIFYEARKGGGGAGVGVIACGGFEWWDRVSPLMSDE